MAKDYTLEAFKRLGRGKDWLIKVFNEYYEANTESVEFSKDVDDKGLTAQLTIDGNTIWMRGVDDAITVKYNGQTILDVDSVGRLRIYDGVALEGLIRQEPRLFELLKIPHPDDMALFTSVCSIFDRMSVPAMLRIFKDYAESRGYKDGSRRKKDHAMTYCAFDEFGNGAKGCCYLYRTDAQFDGYEPELMLCLRVWNGQYFIISNGGERFCEVDQSGYIWHWNPKRLRDVINEHKILFDMLGVKE